MKKQDEKFTIFIEDVGDRSVGMYPVTTFKAELDESMVEHLQENEMLGEFEKRLAELVSEFFEAETMYSTFDTEYLKQEEEYYRRMEEEDEAYQVQVS